MKTKTLQEIFNLVIDNKYYHKDNFTHMCYALNQAKFDGVITDIEYKKARNAIKHYLNKYAKVLGSRNSMRVLLKEMNRSCEFEDSLKIYKDWKNRPKTTLK